MSIENSIRARVARAQERARRDAEFFGLTPEDWLPPDVKHLSLLLEVAEAAKFVVDNGHPTPRLRNAIQKLEEEE